MSIILPLLSNLNDTHINLIVKMSVGWSKMEIDYSLMLYKHESIFWSQNQSAALV